MAVLTDLVRTRPEPAWGPVGREVYERTYQRPEDRDWLDTVTRTVDGNLALVAPEHIEDGEREALIDLFYDFKALPAGRHLWMSGVKGRQFLFNCHHAGWDPDDVAAHFGFEFNQLMQGGGVGANYSNRYVRQYGAIVGDVDFKLHIARDHADYKQLTEWRDEDGRALPLTSSSSMALCVGDSREGWVAANEELITAWFSRGKTTLVMDLSGIRPGGSVINGFGGTASGPLFLAIALTKIDRLLRKRAGYRLRSLDAMAMDHYAAEAVIAGNVRRSARMSMKHWADDDIFDFLRCKQDTGEHWSTNISVEIDDDFDLAIQQDDPHAVAVLAAITEGMLLNGEPGIYNRSRAQEGERGEVYCTNPCGEIALEAWENCNLGHVNLGAFAWDEDGAVRAHELMARFLLRATFGDIPDPRQRAVVNRNRRIGVGHFGAQSWLNLQGIRYSDAPDSRGVTAALRRFKAAVRSAADTYADELGIPRPVKCTAIAPTGTIAKLVGGTEGIHPILYKHFLLRVRYSTVDPRAMAAVEEFRSKGHHVEPCIYSANTDVVEFISKHPLVDTVRNAGWNDPTLVEDAVEIPLAKMFAVQALWQREYADNAVSFTANVDPGRVTVSELSALIWAHLDTLKGTTVMPEASRPQAPYQRISEAEYLLHVRAGEEILLSDGDENCATGACPVR